MDRRVHLLIAAVAVICLLAPGPAHAATASFPGESIVGTDGQRRRLAEREERQEGNGRLRRREEGQGDDRPRPTSSRAARR